MFDTLSKYKFIIVIYNTAKIYNFININVKMNENSQDYQCSIEVALDNAKKRINVLDNDNKKSVQEEYKEWINDGLNMHTVLLLREDPII